jgi:protease I
MSGELEGKRVAFVVANEGVEQVELTEPWKAVVDAGGEPVLIAPKDGTVQAFDHLDKGDTFDVDETTTTAEPGRFDAVVLPGGVANPDQLRTDDAAVRFVRAVADAGKPVAAICHGPWTLIEAGLVDGKRMTSWPSLQTDLRNAGADWVDEQLVVDGQLTTSRKPDDLPAFCERVVAAAAS